MKKIFVFAIIALSAVAVSSCAKDNKPADENAGTPLVLGFENWEDVQGSEADDSKTFLNNGSSNSPAIYWSDNNAMDRVLWVFQASTGTRRKYVSTATDISATRSFTPDSGVPDLVANRDIAYALWTGKAGQDNTKLVNGIITSDGSLVVVNPQTLDKSQSFQVNTNIAVAKPSDTYLKNVMGYIRFTNPAGANGKAMIKSLTFQADQYLAGQIEIDYSGNDPVATIIDNEKASHTLTVNSRLLTGGYEKGTWYACLLPGTYTNFKITVTAFKNDGGTSADDETVSFTLNCGTVEIVRSKWTELASLPLTDPNAFEWPNEESSFDYGLAPGDSKTAKVTADSLTSHSISGTVVADGESVTIDKVTYAGKVTFTDKCGGYFTVEGAGTQTGLPTRRYVSFNINKPGTVSFFPRYPSDKPTLGFRIILKTKKNGAVTTKDLYNATPENRSTSDPNNIAGGYSDYLISATVTRQDLLGIDEPATIYICHHTVYTGIHYIYLTWKP